MNKIPDNYRQLKPNETLRKGDLYHYQKQTNWIEIMPCNSERTVASWPEYVFFRRRHTAKQAVKPVTFVKPAVKDNTKKDKKLVVTFTYPSSQTGREVERTVQVISLTPEYLTGLEIINLWSDENRGYLPLYQFKKFNRGCIKDAGDIKVVSFE
jgi:hypothetical protein